MGHPFLTKELVLMELLEWRRLHLAGSESIESTKVC